MTAAVPLEVIWHDVECGGYSGDLRAWRDLAAHAPSGPILEIGCGTGRIALDLARDGHEVVGVDSQQELLDAMRERAAARGLTGVRAAHSDARELRLEERFGLVLLPMQVLQLFQDAEERRRVLLAAQTHLAPDGLVAAAIVEGLPVEGRIGSEYEPALPDVAELDGWVYSSLPLEVSNAVDRMIVSRLRQVVAPDGDFSEAVHRTSLAIVTRSQIEQEAHAAGLRVRRHEVIDDTADHVGSTIIVMDKAAAG